MTREEAIKGLTELRKWRELPYCIEEPNGEEGVAVITRKALDMAISALKENKGEWIREYDEDGKTGWYECSCCHSERAFNTNFCPDCGADMRGVSE